MKRLAGDDQDGTSGGGLPLPEALSVIGQVLYDDPPCTLGELTAAVRGRVFHKERRVLAIYGRWEEFTADLLAEMEDKDLARQGEDGWRLTKRARTGVARPVITLPSGGTVDMVVFGRAEREHRSKMAELGLDTHALLARFSDAGLLTEMRETGFDLILRGMDVPEPRKNRMNPSISGHHDLTGYLERYLRTHPGWHKITDVAGRWNAEHPDEVPLDGNYQGSMRKRARDLYDRGLLDRKPWNAVIRGKMARGYLWKWKGE
jgi:hypothetical protein